MANGSYKYRNITMTEREKKVESFLLYIFLKLFIIRKKYPYYECKRLINFVSL